MSSLTKANSSLAPNAPSPTPSNTSANGAKRKRPEETRTSVVYSQPQDTDRRNHDATQLTYALQFLEAKPDVWYTFKEIMDYLNIREEDPVRRRIKYTFQHTTSQHSKVEYDPATKKYRFKPKHDVRSNNDLLRFLQTQKSAQGLPVRELKTGWPNVQEDLKELVEKKEILVKRNTKDNNIKTVWANDSTLMKEVDPEFKAEWHLIGIPGGQDDLRKTLLAAGLKPSSAPRAPLTAKPKETKRKTARRGGKQTNTHMSGILKDFSHLRR